MNGQPKPGSIARRRAMSVAVCAAIAVVAGGLLLAAPAQADVISASPCTTPSTLVDSSGSGTGVIDLGTSGTGLTVGVDCASTVGLGGGGTSATSTPVATTGSGTSTEPSTTATDPTVIATAPAESAGTASNSVSTASAASSQQLASLAVMRSSNTVYPVKDGYRDSVRFAVRAINASGAYVPVVGSAVLRRGSATVKSWAIDGSTKLITWNGRVGRSIKAGLYTLTVIAWSADGSRLTERTMVRVLTKHLVRHAMVVRTNVGTKSVSADLPRALLKAYATGVITVRVRTVASVRGPARLVFSNDGVVRGIALRNGTHTTKALPMPQGFSHVTITHDWKKGDAHLTSLKAIWTYSTLS